jgi:hypothetical protein
MNTAVIALHFEMASYPETFKYEDVSKRFRTGAAMYTAVVLV